MPQHFERSRSYDTALVALEAIVVAGVTDEDARASRASMLHAYCVRIGAIIAGCDADDRADLMTIAHQGITESVDIVRMLRS